MTEQKIEKIVIDKMKSALEMAGVDYIQYIGVWQPSQNDGIKALEDGSKRGFLSVKVFPREYDTPTIPDGRFNIQLSLAMRADMDKGGQDYLAVTEAIQKVSIEWQKSYQAYAQDFTIEDEFQPTGFNIDSGDVGLDKENCLWQFSQAYTLYGIIHFQ